MEVEKVYVNMAKRCPINEQLKQKTNNVRREIRQ